MSDSERVLIYTTWPDSASAEAAGRALVQEKLAACVNILGAATAIYAWQGTLERDTEHPMLIKTRRALVPGVLAAVRRLHPYDVPAAAVLPISDGDPEFLAWISTQTRTPDEMGNEDASNHAK